MLSIAIVSLSSIVIASNGAFAFAFASAFFVFDGLITLLLSLATEKNLKQQSR